MLPSLADRLEVVRRGYLEGHRCLLHLTKPFTAQAYRESLKGLEAALLDLDAAMFIIRLQADALAQIEKGELREPRLDDGLAVTTPAELARATRERIARLGGFGAS